MGLWTGHCYIATLLYCNWLVIIVWSVWPWGVTSFWPLMRRLTFHVSQPVTVIVVWSVWPLEESPPSLWMEGQFLPNRHLSHHTLFVLLGWQPGPSHTKTTNRTRYNTAAVHWRHWRCECLVCYRKLSVLYFLLPNHQIYVEKRSEQFSEGCMGSGLKN